MNQHEIDTASVRVWIEHDPDTRDIVGCYVWAKCLCGMDLSASGASLWEATDRLVDLAREHAEEAKSASGEQPPPPAVG